MYKWICEFKGQLYSKKQLGEEGGGQNRRRRRVKRETHREKEQKQTIVWERNQRGQAMQERERWTECFEDSLGLSCREVEGIPGQITNRFTLLTLEKKNPATGHESKSPSLPKEPGFH